MGDQLTIFRGVSFWLLLPVVVAFHLLIACSVTLLGHLAPAGLFNENGLTIMAPDNIHYLSLVRSLAETLIRDGVDAWRAAPAPNHLKLYSLGFAALGPWLGSAVLCAEPINLLCYLAILLLTFRLGEEIFSRTTGIFAAGVVALWPSFLLLTTQLLKDPLFVSGLLLLFWVITLWLTRVLSPRNGLKTGLIGGVAIYFMNFVRDDLWSAIILQLTAVGIFLLFVRHIRKKRFFAGNVLSALLVLLALITVLLSSKEPFQSAPPPQETTTQDFSMVASLKAHADSAARRISQLRHEFVRLHGDAGSNIDAVVEFKTVEDVLGYLPRAMMIGFLAPFPDQWFVQGRTSGLFGRLISGLETSVVYLFECLALIELWRSRSRLPVWLLMGMTSVGVTSLALAVINVGTLYRMRYGFFILLIVLATNRLLQAVSTGTQSRRQDDIAKTGIR